MDNKKQKAVKKMARQGDVLIRRTRKTKPAGEQLVDERGTILAEGEATGHAHRLDPTTTALFPLTEDTKLLKVDKPSGLRHEEHAMILLDKGDYEIIIQEEYVYGQSRVVAD